VTDGAGILVDESGGAEEAISRIATAITAFVGRTLRGPVDRAVPVRSFAEFQQVFGGLWQPSPLSYSVEQFFENGGQCALVVRVVNGGAPVTISLSCGGQTLVLEALSHGTREVLRAAVDYDNLPEDEPHRFNLVVQRLRAAGSERIEDQEIYPRLSVLAREPRYVATALLDSQLVRVRGMVPLLRPDVTVRPGSRSAVGYVHANPDGDDGAPLTDYDLIGSAEQRTGLFALRGEEFQFLCLPPLERDRDVGLSSLLVAERLSRDRGAILVMDPPAEWDSPEAALRGVRRLELRSDHAVMFFPRILAYDRLRGRYESFANGGAVTGTLARLEALRSPWQPGPDEDVLLRPGTRPLLVLADAERARLANHGVNALQSLRSAHPTPFALRTLGGGSLSGAEGALLAPLRRTLLILNSIERGTRWVLLAGQDRAARQRLVRQVQAFLKPLAEQGVFGGEPGTPATAVQVVCDERINDEHDLAEGRVNLLVTLRAAGELGYQSYLITHAREGSRIRPVRSLQHGSGRAVIRLHDSEAAVASAALAVRQGAADGGRAVGVAGVQGVP
jgi:hypothetical protein